MKTIVLTVSMLLFITAQSCSQNHQPDDAAAVYAASTPCSQGTRPLPGMDAEIGCELMKWKLVLHEHTFELHCEYGMTKASTKGFSKGKSLDLSGSWTIQKGTPAHPQATVYQLKDGKTHKNISFIRLSNELLHLLDADGHLMIGNGGWSYTLSKVTAK
ncbi:hypothetical protein ACFOTA_05980 [Chitinophaga sp. GCM10012297]|uniref:NlpE N-terminal domain-containing protein n=1 Tax=Chitinophaga chungangae TaxID=2821488 RepID=A0ABS3YAN3_9BACT|nr:hypothetical protein [Chitinophaga chungangae]MBO9151747.1 hypothetical protein [Chitinophaga chungangae]